MNVETARNSPSIPPDGSLEPTGATQEAIQKELFITQIPFAAALLSGLILATVGERLSPSTRTILAGIFSANVVAFHALLIRAGRKVNFTLKPSGVTLDQAIEILEKPLDRDLIPAMREALALPRETRLSLGSGDSGVLLLPGESSKEPSHQEGTVTIFESLLPEKQVIVGTRVEATRRVLREFTDKRRRGAYFSEESRLKALEGLHSQIKKGDLFGHPEAAFRLKTAIVANLIEGSPLVLTKMAEIIKDFFINLTARESWRVDRMNSAYWGTLSTAVRAGVDIPASIEKTLLRGQKKGLNDVSFLETGPFSAIDIEAFALSLVSIYLRPMPETREPARKAILAVRDSFSKIPQGGRLAEVGEKILRLLEFGEMIPSLDLGISVHELVRKRGLWGASIDFVLAESLGLDERLGLISLVTLPKKGEVSLNTLGDILTWMGIRYPFAGSFAIARGPLVVGKFGLEAWRKGKLTGETGKEIGMLFGGEAVLHWLLDGRKPNDLLRMNLKGRQEIVDSNHLLMQTCSG